MIRRVNAPRSAFHRSDWYKGGRFVPNEDTLLSMTDDAEHKALRAKMTPGVSTPLVSEAMECKHLGQLRGPANPYRRPAASLL